MLRNSIDIYKMNALLIVLSIWLLHWLLAKRTKGLVGEENRDKGTHGRLLSLYAMVITFDGLLAYLFAVQFFKNSKQIDDIYLMIGFEVSNSIPVSKPFPNLTVACVALL